MRILSLQYGNIINPYSHGGLALALHESLKRLTVRHDITCFTGLLSGETQSGKMEIDGVKYIQVGKGNNKYINRLSFSLTNSFSRSFKSYDIVLVPWDRYAPLWMPSVPHCPAVLELALEFFSIPSKLKVVEPLTRFLLKRNLKTCRYFIAMSEGVRKIASKYVKKVKLSEVLPGGIPGEILQDTPGTGNEDYLLYIGRLDISHKGIDILLESYKAANIDLPLVIAGDGIDKIKVEKIIRKLGLNKKVKTVGWVRGKEKYRLIGNCLAVCIPSRVEGWGIVATEAAAMGKPVIGTKVVGLEESILDGKTGILVPNDNVTQFSKTIKIMVQNKELRTKLGKHARETARQYTWEKIAAKRELFFHKVIEDFRRTHTQTKIKE
jgi:glycosyltransferase involved in cell wall biosynthesis